MNKHYLVTVIVKDINEKGKVTKTTEQYLVKDQTGCTEAEAAVVKKFVDEGNNLDYEVKSVKSTNILSVIE